VYTPLYLNAKQCTLNVTNTAMCPLSHNLGALCCHVC